MIKDPEKLEQIISSQEQLMTHCELLRQTIRKSDMSDERKERIMNRSDEFIERAQKIIDQTKKILKDRESKAWKTEAEDVAE